MIIECEKVDFVSERYASLNDLLTRNKITLDKLENIDVNKFPSIKNIPMMHRRRLNTAGRMAVGLSLSILNECENVENIQKLIFVSRYGESLRCVSLLNELVSQENISPSEFSYSVHNSNVGIASTISKFNLDTTAITSGINSLKSGLIDAYASLKARAISKVLVVIYEENILKSSIITNGNYLKDAPYALAMLCSLTKSQNSFSIDINSIEDGIEILDFIQKYINLCVNEN